MAGFLQELRQTIAARRLFHRGQKILVAVSGGVDSMALLHALHALASTNDWTLAVAHLNHKLRGRASNADEELVHKITRKLCLRLVSEHADVRALAAERKISIEMAARALRHDFLARNARRLRINTIAVAHHADDQLELFFLRLLRGSGGDGLSGMKWRTPSPADSGIELVRPFLGIGKNHLKAYAIENRIPFREDKSNASLDIQRNRIRHELLPLLTDKYQPALTTTLQRVIEIVGAESELAKASAKRWLQQKSPRAFSKLPVAVQRRVLQLGLIAADISPEFDLVERLRNAPNTHISVASSQTVYRDAKGKVRLVRNAIKQAVAATQVDIGRKGRIVFNGAKVFWSVEQQKAFRRPIMSNGRELFDADRVGSQIVLRHWQAGDRFQPIGMSSLVKLQDLFVNAKIPKGQRDSLMVATTARNEIFWVERLRMSEQFKLTPQTTRRLRWSWRT